MTTPNPVSVAAGFVRPRWNLRSFLALLLSLQLAGAALAAEAEKKTFNVPAGEAIETLKQAAQQGGIEIMFSAEVVRGVRTNAVQGELPAREAINQMLTNTELYVVTDDKTGAMSVRRVMPAERVQEKSRSAAPDESQPVVLSPFEVSEDRARGYQATTTASATRLNTPIVELSKSIQIMTRDLIDDLKVTELNSALYMSSSVSYTQPYSGRVAVRGFENATAKRNGLGNYGADESFTDTATIERIEIVKGPSSLLYGSSSPGGVVNYETKKPTAYKTGSLRMIAGSWNKRRVELDSGGPLIGSGDGVNYRFVAAYEAADGYSRYDTSERGSVAGTVRWHISSDTYLLAGLERNRSRRTNIRPGGFPVFRSDFNPDGSLGELFVGYYLSEEAREYPSIYTTPRNRHDSNVLRYDLDFSHKFTDNLSVFAHYNFIDNNLNEAYLFTGIEGLVVPASPAPAPGRGEMLLDGTLRFPHRKSDNGTVNLTYHLENDWSKTDIVVGWEYYKFKLRDGGANLGADYRPLVNFITGEGYDQLNMANTYDGVWQGIRDGVWNFAAFYNRTQEYNAPYLLIHSHLFDNRLRVVGGIRRDKIEIHQAFYPRDTTSADRFAVQAPRLTDSPASATTPMVGLSVSPFNNRGISIYANYSESLVANEIVNPDGSTLPAETGEGLEVGVKFDLNKRFSGTLSWFKIDRTNLARGILGSSPQAWEASGLQRSEGVDMDLFYAITPDWQVMANAAFIDAYYVNDGNASLIGTKLGSVSPWAWSAWTKYTFSKDSLKGLSIGGGAISRAECLTHGAGAPNLIAPQFTRFDFLFGYSTTIQGREVEFSLKLNNVFDEVYMEGQMGFGDPRNVQTSVTIHF